MKTIQQIKNTSGSWLFLIPVQGLRLTKAVNYEFTVNMVTFIDAKRIATRRKRLGFPTTLSDLKLKGKGTLDSFFEDHETFAILRLTGNGQGLKKQYLDIIKEELSILSLSQLGYNRRRHNSKPSVYYNERPECVTGIMQNTTVADTSYITRDKVGKVGPLNLDKRWHYFHKKYYFHDLINILSGKTEIAPHFRTDIRNASILAGQSQSSIDIPQCFLWNMIALETLLTQGNDKYIDKLPERTEAFMGWVQDWEIENFSNKIRDVYQKRCKFVHTGKTDNIKIEDILFTDDLVLNVLMNIVRHPKLFGSKEKIIDFSDKVQAEHLLGIKPKVRPQTLRLLRPMYQEQDFEKI